MPRAKYAITPRQKVVARALIHLSKKLGFPPTHQEIADYLKLASGPSVRKHLVALKKKQYVAHTYNQTRSYRVLIPKRNWRIQGGRPKLVGAGNTDGGEYGRRSGTRRQAIAKRKKELIVLMEDALASKDSKPLRRHVAEFVMLCTAPKLWHPGVAKKR